MAESQYDVIMYSNMMLLLLFDKEETAQVPLNCSV